MQQRNFFAAVIIGLTFLAGAMLAQSPATQRSPAVEVLAKPRDIAPFTLQTVNGPWTDKDLINQWSLLIFGFRTCPDVCPSNLSEARNLLQQLQETPLQLVFISVDAVRDPPLKLAEYVQSFHPQSLGATGEHTALKALARSLGIQFEVSESGAVGHSVTLSLIGPKGRLLGRLRPGFDPIQAAAEISALIRSEP